MTRPRDEWHNDRVQSIRGFILQASYRVVGSPGGERIPVIHLYGRLEGGGTFLVRDDRQRPHFYIRTADVDRARVTAADAGGRTTFDGAAVSRIEAESPQDIPSVRDRLHRAGIETFEADVRFAVRYLIERNIKGSCEIEGPSVPGAGITRVFDNPVLRPADVKVTPRVLSFDIETEDRKS